MTTATFFRNFQQFTEAPYAIPKLRELILDLAVRGKLVRQSPFEGNSDSLLSQIRERNPPSKTGDQVAASGASSWRLPDSWNLSSLGEVCTIVRGVSFPGDAKLQKKEQGTVACLRTASVQAEINWDDLIYISQEHVGRDDQWVMKDDIMISMANSYALVGKVAIVRDLRQKTTFGAFLAAIRPVLIDPFFLLYALRSPRMQAAFRDSSSQTTNIANISLSKMRPLPFPLPPLAEQRRIVKKLDELMAICDRLEAQHRECEVRHSALIHAAVSRFNGDPTLANLNFLFHTSYSVPPPGLRESILSVAIRGKLEPQNSNDESATSLLESIAKFRGRWLDGKRDKSSKRIREIDNKKCSYDIPASWTWCRLGDIVLEFRYGTSRKCSRDHHGVPVLRIPNIQAGRIDATDLKFTSMPSSELTELQLQRGDLLVVRSNGSEKLVGRSAVVFPEDEQFVYAGYLVRLRIPQEFICPRYLQLALSSAEVRNQIEGPIRTTSGVKNINTTELSNLVFPLAPLAEQRRIVDRIDRLTPLVDKLEAQLAISQGISTKLLDAAVHEILHSEDGLVAPSDLRQESTPDRSSIGCYVINQLTQNPNFGRTMLMKMFYLSETHIGLPQGWQPLRQAAGPYDPTIEDFESLGVQSGWFTVKTRILGNGHEMVQYQSKSGMEAKIAEAVSVLGGERTEFDRLLNLFQNKTTEEAEIIATLFAAWNDLLIDGKSPSDDEIIREVREDWHYKKERFTPPLLTRWLNWLRQQGVIPRGLAPRTRQQLKLGLS